MDDFVVIKISAAFMRQRFHGCEPDYIRDVCHAACCKSSVHPNGTIIAIHPDEQEQIEKRGGIVMDGLLQPKPGERKCPFHDDDWLCTLHFTSDKPYNCRFDPFTINANGTLIVRNKARLLRCYKTPNSKPAYIAFKGNLDYIMGKDKADKLVEHLEAGGGDIYVKIPRINYERVMFTDATYHSVTGKNTKKPATQAQFKLLEELCVL